MSEDEFTLTITGGDPAFGPYRDRYMCIGIPYSGLFSWGANFRYFRDSQQVTKFSTHEIFNPY